MRPASALFLPPTPHPRERLSPPGTSTFRCFLKNYRSHAAHYAQCRLFSLKKKTHLYYGQFQAYTKVEEVELGGAIWTCWFDSVKAHVITTLHFNSHQPRANPVSSLAHHIWKQMANRHLKQHLNQNISECTKR